ncbi:hypothetical protein AGDE_02341 [Angomonas deanei]|uniref:Uncharacterized protein n=1 Tax=Angomonas deanei TaxID=59799 RepID=A0A7G2CNE6_9TRYP|nr:hypothetical protein AGDE_02341 [Angomonas deanei]CAD2220474.1 hypothetical protein, conserved [Angomonas deanei]|eukprot:EPY41583.1 hypothetical protein AGDE_02341 [Angomonas deanei]
MSDEADQQLDALRRILELHQKKEPIPSELYQEAGVKDKARIKDIEKEIKAVKGRIGSNNKQKAKINEEENLKAEAEAAGMTLEDYKESLKEKNNQWSGDYRDKERQVAQDRAESRAKKETRLNQGDFDL